MVVSHPLRQKLELEYTDEDKAEGEDTRIEQTVKSTRLTGWDITVKQPL